MAATNKFSITHIVLSILTTAILMGGAMYSISSNLILGEVRSELRMEIETLRDTIDLESTKLEVRVESKLGDTKSALDKLEDAVYAIEKNVITLQQQQLADLELRSMVGEVGKELQRIRTEIAKLNVRTASVSELADKVGQLSSQVLLLNEKAKKK